MSSGTSRRAFLKGSAAVGLAAGATAGSGVARADDDKHEREHDRREDLLLINGHIRTFDSKDSVVSSVRIHNGRFAAVGNGHGNGGDARVINLRGRTVLPGLIDNHNHIVLLGLRPGFDTRLENAASIAEIQAALRQRARTVPAGGFLTAIGGWDPNQ